MSKNKRKILILLFVSITLAILGVGVSELCSWESQNIICRSVRFFGLTSGSNIFFFTSLSFASLSLLFRPEVFVLWSKFAIPYFIVYILITIVPINRTGSMGTGPYITEEVLAIFLAVLFILISLGLIAYKTIQLRKKEKEDIE